MDPLPPLRNLDVIPVEHEGEQLICLQDTQGFVEGQLLLSPTAFFLAAAFDGEKDAETVRREFVRQFNGVQVSPEELRELVAALDAQGFLYNETFFRIQEEVEQRYRAAPARPAGLAGKSYPDDPAELREFIDGFFTHPEGPGALPAAGDAKQPPLRCVVVPHIDFQRGGHSYAHGYSRLYSGGKPDTVFVFGVAHAGAPVPFVLTRKDFETPFGVVQTDQASVDALASACDWDPFAWELVHRTEHSIEFQAVMLAYLYGPDVSLVPVLCAAFSEDSELSRPGEVAQVNRFLEACKRYAADPSRRVTAIASADLAHVGKRFGDAFEVDEGVLNSVAARDTEDLAHLERIAAESFYASVMKDANARKVCGLGCIYAALRTVEGHCTAAERLHYGYAEDPLGGIVSFSSLVAQ